MSPEDHKHTPQTTIPEELYQKYRQAIDILFAGVKDVINPTNLTNLDQQFLVIDHEIKRNTTMCKEISDILWWNQTDIQKTAAWLWHAIRSISWLADIYIQLGWTRDTIKQDIKWLVYRMATISMRDLGILSLHLKIWAENPNRLLPYQVPYHRDNFYRDDHGHLQIDDNHITQQMRKSGKCPAVWLTTSSYNSPAIKQPIIDYIIDCVVASKPI